MAHGDIARQMDSVHLQQLNDLEVARDAAVGTHKERERLEGLLADACEQASLWRTITYAYARLVALRSKCMLSNFLYCNADVAPVRLPNY